MVAALMLLPSLQVSLLKRGADPGLRVPVCDRLVAADGRDRVQFQPDLGHRPVATLLLTCLVLVAAMGRTGPLDRVAALSIAAVVCIAASTPRP